ncbi:MAG: phosphate regulon sensor histidine kinase PhoR [Zoogloeaceae bacterium]|nr:phosphate regulon sensor histidine kinase PhoR [Zoogloeaceae bacterium]
MLFQVVAKTAVGAAIALALGMLVSPVFGWGFFSVFLLVQMASHLGYFLRLEAWSRNPSPDRDLDGDGIWHEIFSRLIRHERQLHADIARRDQDLKQVAAAGQAIVDGIVTLDSGNRIGWCNRTAERLLGIDLKVDRGLPIANLVRQPEFVSYLAAGDYSRPLRMSIERQEDRVLSVHVLPYAGNERLLQVRDVTDIERLDHMRRDFVANVSHELRTPLTVLSGFVETLRELDLEPDEQARYLGMMFDQSVRMQQIVQDLLTLSTLESSPPPPERDRINMSALLANVKRDAEVLSGGRHHISLQIEAGDIYGSESELHSAFGNLATNAVRYTPDGGQISLYWKTEGEQSIYSVTDNGVGIDPKHIPRLTERFYRADLGRSRETGGTGLGLAIVKHALSRHQAVLDITSNRGEGSCFKAVFPAARRAA